MILRATVVPLLIQSLIPMQAAIALLIPTLPKILATVLATAPAMALAMVPNTVLVTALVLLQATDPVRALLNHLLTLVAN